MQVGSGDAPVKGARIKWVNFCLLRNSAGLSQPTIPAQFLTLPVWPRQLLSVRSVVPRVLAVYRTQVHSPR